MRKTMAAVTYGVAPVAERKAGNEKGIFTMLFEAIANAQMQRAERELARYRYLIADRKENEPLIVP